MSFPVSFAAAQLVPPSHLVVLGRFRPSDFRAQADERLSAGGEGKGEWIKGRVPEEDRRDPPRAAPGSHNLPWDTSSIATKTACPPGPGGWDGERVSAKAAGGDSRPGGRTNATAESQNVRSNCAGGRRPSVSRSAVPALKDVDSTRRRNASDANGRRTKAARWSKAKPRRPSPPASPRVVTQQRGILKFFAIVPVVMSRCEIRLVWPPAIAVTPAVRP